MGLITATSPVEEDERAAGAALKEAGSAAPAPVSGVDSPQFPTSAAGPANEIRRLSGESALKRTPLESASANFRAEPEDFILRRSGRIPRSTQFRRPSAV